jgi:hypothetical protein
VSKRQGEKASHARPARDLPPAGTRLSARYRGQEFIAEVVMAEGGEGARVLGREGHHRQFSERLAVLEGSGASADRSRIAPGSQARVGGLGCRPFLSWAFLSAPPQNRCICSGSS